MKIGRYFRELSEHSRFFDEKNAKARKIVFYSERDIYYQYFEGLIEELLKDEACVIGYLTSDENDPIFTNHHPRLLPFFVDKLLPSTLAKLKADVLVMTMPDLNKYHVKKSPGTKNHVYMFHAIVSTHLQYRKGAFDAYDTIFCVGPHHVREIRKAEELYGLKPKTLVESGYFRLEKIYRQHQEYLTKAKPSGQKTLLVAPTWGSSSLLELCPDQLIASLATLDWRCVIRPHPEFLKRNEAEAKRIAKLVAGQRNIVFETDMVSDVSIHSADALVTDRSGIAFEYALGTERPVLFVDTPLKVNNPDYHELGIEPLENSCRSALGLSIEVQALGEIPKVADLFWKDRERYRDRIVENRNTHISHWMRSVDVEREFILSCLK